MTANDEDTLTVLLEHSRRRQILRALVDADAPRSPIELADDLGVPLPTLTYHVRRLVEFDALSLDSTAPSGGSLKHFYVLGPLVERNRDFVTVFLDAD